MTDHGDEVVPRASESATCAFDPGVIDAMGGESVLRTVVATVSDAILATDGDGTIVFANPAIEAMLGYEPDDLIGDHLSVLVPERYREQFEQIGEQWVGGSGIEQLLSHRSGDEMAGLLTFTRHEHPNRDLFVVQIKEIEWLRERERALREEQAFIDSVLDTIPDVFYAFDTDGRMLRWNDELTEQTGYTDEEIAGMHPLDSVREADREQMAMRIAKVLTEGTTETMESALLTKDGREIPHEFNGSRIVDEEGNVLGVTGIGRDITERKARERALAEAEEKYRRLVESAPDAIFIADAKTGIIRDANAAAEDLIGRPREQFRGMHQTDLHPPKDAERYRRMFEEHGAREGFFEAGGDVYVVHADGHEIPVEINAATAEISGKKVIQGIFRDLTERRRREEELAAQRDELETLNRINTVIRSVNQGLVGATTRAEVEQLVCDRLAAADPYQFAWIGSVASGTERIDPHAWAGIGDEEIAGIDITLDENDLTGRGPTAAAVREEEVTVCQDILHDPAYAPWHDRAREHDYRSSAAIPVRYEGRLYGVLSVYAERPDAFDERERAVLGELGETIGHAINALERKEGLMTDSVIEIEFRIADVTGVLGEASAETNGTVTFERTIPAGDGSYLQFATVRGIPDDRMREFVENSPSAERIKRIGARGDATLYEITYDDPPLLSTVATFGGRVREVTMEDGEFRFVADLPDSIDVRTVVDRIREAVPNAEFVAQRQRARRGRTANEYGVTIEDWLTEKQRSALEAAYFAGYFDRPRTSTGAEVAESLGVTASTFHQHLQVGLRKMLSAAFDESGSGADT